MSLKTLFWTALLFVIGYGLWVQEIRPRLDDMEADAAEQSAVEDTPDDKQSTVQKTLAPAEEAPPPANSVNIEKTRKPAKNEAAKKKKEAAAQEKAAAALERATALKEKAAAAKEKRLADYERKKALTAQRRALEDKISTAYKKLRQQEYEWSRSRIKRSEAERTKLRKKVEAYVADLKRQIAELK